MAYLPTWQTRDIYHYETSILPRLLCCWLVICAACTYYLQPMQGPTKAPKV